VTSFEFSRLAQSHADRRSCFAPRFAAARKSKSAGCFRGKTQNLLEFPPPPAPRIANKKKPRAELNRNKQRAEAMRVRISGGR
jgi:hypothetical protein